MLVHVVLFKFRADATSRLDEAVAAFQALAGEIEVLRSLRVGRNVLPSERAYDLCLVAELDAPEALAAYRAHPAHRRVAAWVDECSASTVSVDFDAPVEPGEGRR